MGLYSLKFVKILTCLTISQICFDGSLQNFYTMPCFMKARLLQSYETKNVKNNCFFHMLHGNLSLFWQIQLKFLHIVRNNIRRIHVLEVRQAYHVLLAQLPSSVMQKKKIIVSFENLVDSCSIKLSLYFKSFSTTIFLPR